MRVLSKHLGQRGKSWWGKNKTEIVPFKHSSPKSPCDRYKVSHATLFCHREDLSNVGCVFDWFPKGRDKLYLSPFLSQVIQLVPGSAVPHGDNDIAPADTTKHRKRMGKFPNFDWGGNFFLGHCLEELASGVSTDLGVTDLSKPQNFFLRIDKEFRFFW